MKFKYGQAARYTAVIVTAVLISLVLIRATVALDYETPLEFHMSYSETLVLFMCGLATFLFFGYV